MVSIIAYCIDKEDKKLQLKGYKVFRKRATTGFTMPFAQNGESSAAGGLCTELVEVRVSNAICFKLKDPANAGDWRSHSVSEGDTRRARCSFLRLISRDIFLAVFH
jgi:hypothetical protein